MISISLDQPRNPGHIGIFPTRIVREPAHRLESMRFNVSFIAYVHTVVVAISVKGRIVRIMTGPNSIEVVLPVKQPKKKDIVKDGTVYR